MKTLIAAATAALALAGPSLASAAEIEFRDVIANVRIIPEARSDFAVSITRSRPDLPPMHITRTASGVLVDGGLRRRLKSCGGPMGISVKDGPRFGRNDMPQIVVRAPVDFAVRSSGLVDGDVGPSRSFKLDNEGCGRWNVADVSDRLTVAFEGVGHVNAARAGSANLSLQGLGNIDLASLSGPLNANVEGLGGINVHGGHASSMHASLEGMGHINFDGVADTLDASASGMGVIRVSEVRGSVRKSQDGFARVKVGR